jgi:plastocyanin
MRTPIAAPFVALALSLVAGIALVASCKRSEPVAPPAASAPPAAPPSPVAAAPALHAEAAATRVKVEVTEAGFVPETIAARAGKPLTLAITRKTEKTCAREIIITGKEGKTELPMGKEVEVMYTPKTAGKVTFGCAMGMMIGGVLDVQP